MIQVDINRERRSMLNATLGNINMTNMKVNICIDNHWQNGLIHKYDTTTKNAVIILDNKDSVKLCLSQSIRNNKCWVHGKNPDNNPDHQACHKPVLRADGLLRPIASPT